MVPALVLTPVIISSWPAIAAAVAAAAAAMGLTMKESAKQAVQARAATQVQAQEHVEVELRESEVIADQVSAGQEIVLNKEGIELRIRRDEHGRCVVCASGLGQTKEQLQAMAEEFSQRVTQCFMYNKVVTELKAKGFQVVNEEVMDDQSIRIHVRRWEE